MVDNMTTPVVSVPSPVAPVSFFGSIKESVMNVWLKIKDSKSLILDSMLFFGVGFLIGFFLRKYGQYVAAFIVFIVCLIILAQLNIVDVGINWNKIQQIIGVQPEATQKHALVSIYWDWLKANLVPVASFCVGFLFGLRMN